MNKKQLTPVEVENVLHQLESYLKDLQTRWDNENPGNRSWFRVTQTYLLASTHFLVSVLDELILFVEGIIPAGEDKKSAVTTLLDRLFDYIVVQAFPFWLKPFAGIIKGVVINILISHLIDFIVAKYNAGFWKQEANNGEADKVA